MCATITYCVRHGSKRPRRSKCSSNVLSPNPKSSMPGFFCLGHWPLQPSCLFVIFSFWLLPHVWVWDGGAMVKKHENYATDQCFDHTNHPSWQPLPWCGGILSGSPTIVSILDLLRFTSITISVNAERYKTSSVDAISKN